MKSVIIMKSHASTVLVRCALINSGLWYMLENLKIHEIKYLNNILQVDKLQNSYKKETQET